MVDEGVSDRAVGAHEGWEPALNWLILSILIILLDVFECRTFNLVCIRGHVLVLVSWGLLSRPNKLKTRCELVNANIHIPKTKSACRTLNEILKKVVVGFDKSYIQQQTSSFRLLHCFRNTEW